MTGDEHLKKAAIATIRKASERLDSIINLAIPEFWETQVRIAQKYLAEAIETLEDRDGDE